MLRAAILSGTLVAFVLPGPARAAGEATRDWPSMPRRGEGAAGPPCTCRGPGTEIEVGAETCLATPSGSRRARCVMVLNNTSWSVSDDACGTSAALSR